MTTWPRPMLRWMLCAAVAAALAGCSTGPRLVDGRVQSFSSLAALPAPATYRIELLPSQQVSGFAPIAALAGQSLARAGLVPDDAAPRLLVQIGVQAGVVPRYDPYAPYAGWPGHPWGWGFGGWSGRGWGVHGTWALRQQMPPLHRRAVSIVLRDAATRAVVYETSAVHEDVWVADPAVYGALFDAALTGFPQPPQGVRQVRLPLHAAPAASVVPTPAPPSPAAPAERGVVR